MTQTTSTVADIFDDDFIPTDEQVAYGGSDYPWADTDIDWCRVANDRAATIIRQTQELEQSDHDLHEALIQRDLWSVLAFVVGVVCGVGLAVLFYG